MADDNPGIGPGSRRGSVSTFLLWIVLSAICVTAWTLICAHAPARIRLIGLFAVGYGLGAGWLLKQLARKLAFEGERFIPWLVGLLVVAGQIGLAVESHRLFVNEMRRSLENDKARSALAALLQNNAPEGDPTSRKMLDDMRESLGLHTEFRGYLARRLAPFGRWSSPWPEIFWSLEIAASAAAAVWIASQSVSREFKAVSRPCD